MNRGSEDFENVGAEEGNSLLSLGKRDLDHWEEIVKEDGKEEKSKGVDNLFGGRKGIAKSDLLKTKISGGRNNSLDWKLQDQPWTR